MLRTEGFECPGMAERRETERRETEALPRLPWSAGCSHTPMQSTFDSHAQIVLHGLLLDVCELHCGTRRSEEGAAACRNKRRWPRLHLPAHNLKHTPSQALPILSLLRPLRRTQRLLALRVDLILCVLRIRSARQVEGRRHVMHLFIADEGVSVQSHNLPTPSVLREYVIGPDQHSIIPPSFAHVSSAGAAVAAHRLGTGDDS